MIPTIEFEAVGLSGGLGYVLSIVYFRLFFWGFFVSFFPLALGEFHLGLIAFNLICTSWTKFSRRFCVCCAWLCMRGIVGLLSVGCGHCVVFVLNSPSLHISTAYQRRSETIDSDSLFEGARVETAYQLAEGHSFVTPRMN